MKNVELRNILKQHNPEHIINTLSPFILDKRKSRIESVIVNRIESITVAIESPADMNNALAVVRSAEALGLLNIHIIAPEHEAISIRSVTQGTYYWIQTHFYDSAEKFIAAMQKQNYLLAAAIVDSTTSLSAITIDQPICLVFGNENRGLSQTMRNACAISYTIPITGMAESLNLSVSAAISLYDLTQRKRGVLEQSGDISPTSCTQLRAQYYLNSVNPRLIKQLLCD